VEENWILEKWNDIKDIVRRVRKLGREVEERPNKGNMLESKVTQNHYVTNFIQPYLHQFFDNSHSLSGTQKPLKRPFD